MATLASYFHPSFFETWLEAQLQAATPLHCALINSTIAVETDSLATIVGNEVAATNGYSRQSISTAGTTLTYDATNNRADISDLTCAFAASGGDITFRSAILIIGGTGTQGNTTGSILQVVQWPIAQTLLDAAPAFQVKFQIQLALGTYNTAGTNPVFA